MVEENLDGYHVSDEYMGVGQGGNHIYTDQLFLRFGGKYGVITARDYGSSMMMDVVNASNSDEHELPESYGHMKALQDLEDDVEAVMHFSNNPHAVLRVNDEEYVVDLRAGLAVSGLSNGELLFETEHAQDRPDGENGSLFPPEQRNFQEPTETSFNLQQLEDEDFTEISFNDYGERVYDLENGRESFPNTEPVEMQVEGMDESVFAIMPGERMDKHIRKLTGYGMDGINEEALEEWNIESDITAVLDSIEDIHVRADLQPYQIGDIRSGMEERLYITNTYVSADGENWAETGRERVPRPAAEFFPAMSEEIEVRVLEEPVTDGELLGQDQNNQNNLDQNIVGFE